MDLGITNCDDIDIDGILVTFKYRIPCDGDEKVDPCDPDGPHCSESQEREQQLALRDLEARIKSLDLSQVSFPTNLLRIRLCDGTEMYVFEFELDFISPRYQVLQSIPLPSSDTKIRVKKEDGGGSVNPPRPPSDDPNNYDLFALDLSHDPVGNITKAVWAARQDAIMSYDYSYNNNYWLTKALFKEIAVSGTVDENKYTVKDIEYDARGNIQKLKRNGLAEPCFGDTDFCGRKRYTWRTVDDLTYEYDAVDRNRLDGIIEAADKEYAYKQNPDGIIGYGYDANGNVIADRARNIEKIEYNYMNQPVNIITDAGSIWYTYDALGNRLRSFVPSPESGVPGQKLRIDYVGPFEYFDLAWRNTYFSDGRKDEG